MMIRSRELRLCLYAASLYAVFIIWGYQQEKIAFTPYSTLGSDSSKLKWSYPVALNLGMAAASYGTAVVVEIIEGIPRKVPFLLFWKPALSSALASPIGYESLKYIHYPLMILTKSSKPVPVMIFGIAFYRKVYKWYKYISVLLLCLGIAMFTSNKKPYEENNDIKQIGTVLFGMLLVVINLSMDGYTSNEQDFIFSHHGATSTQMMKYTNCWQCIYQIIYLGGGYILQSSGGEAAEAYHMVMHCPLLKYDILLFCVCASIGQVILFNLMKEYGSLVCVTIGVTRKLLTILISVFMFNHHVSSTQWFGVGLVFTGLLLDITMNYAQLKAKDD